MTSRALKSSGLPAGLIDASLASLATFASGLTGVNILSSSDRGVYGIFFTVFILGVVLVHELIYVPSQVIAIAQDQPDRLNGVRRTIVLATGPGLAAAAVALFASVLTRELTTSSVVVAFTVTVAVLIPISGMQDYVRRSLHIAEKSWQAARVSMIQLFVVGIAIATLMTTDIERAWIPFGSLVIANVVSVSVGLLLAGAHRRTKPLPEIYFRRLVLSGKWLVARSAIPATGAFIAANILTSLAGPVVFGYAEAARQVAQPVTVLSMGLAAVMGPRAVRAGLRSDRSASSHNRRRYSMAVAIAAIGYAVVAGPDWVLNPMSRIVPSAYEVPWLVVATVCANAIVALLILPKSELLGASKEKVLVGLALVSTPMLLIAAASAGTTGAFARPFGLILEGLVVMVGANRGLRNHYTFSQQVEADPISTEGGAA